MVELLLFHGVDKNRHRRVTIRDSFLHNAVHFLLEDLRKIDEGCIESVMVREKASQHWKILALTSGLAELRLLSMLLIEREISEIV
jgi:hypothetical protein